MNKQEQPSGELALQTIAMPRDTNSNGDIFGGWLVSQMDLGAAVLAHKIAGGRTVTVAIEGMSFIAPVNVGAVVSTYAKLLKIGNSSMRIQVEVWMQNIADKEQKKVTEGVFVFVAIDEHGKSRSISKTC